VRPEVKVVAIATPEYAPYGLAAKQALESAGVWAVAAAKLVLGEDIAQTFQFIQTGTAEAGSVALAVVSVLLEHPTC
jgi:molybdate transport system substrate-binding protein